ncbi:hypothetical protein G9A89_008267 [Geosiphon pyriformis]|nr:hypothetical protein G9A89_008267 [Geosiphon pyriformis]
MPVRTRLYLRAHLHILKKLTNKLFTGSIRSKQLRETRADAPSIQSIDSGIRTPITWYSSKGVGKIGSGHIGRIVCLCKYMES